MNKPISRLLALNLLLVLLVTMAVPAMADYSFEPSYLSEEDGYYLVTKATAGDLTLNGIEAMDGSFGHDEDYCYSSGIFFLKKGTTYISDSLKNIDVQKAPVTDMSTTKTLGEGCHVITASEACYVMADNLKLYKETKLVPTTSSFILLEKGAEYYARIEEGGSINNANGKAYYCEEDGYYLVTKSTAGDLTLNGVEAMPGTFGHDEDFSFSSGIFYMKKGSTYISDSLKEIEVEKAPVINIDASASLTEGSYVISANEPATLVIRNSKFYNGLDLINNGNATVSLKKGVQYFVQITKDGWLKDVRNCGFSKQPVGGEISKDEEFTAKWKLAFTPVKMDVCYTEHGSDELHVLIKNIDVEKKSVSISAQPTADQYFIRAFYNDKDYVCSNPFKIIEKAPITTDTAIAIGGTITIDIKKLASFDNKLSEAVDNGDVSYQWYCNGEAIPGATDQSYSPVESDKDCVIYADIIYGSETMTTKESVIGYESSMLYEDVKQKSWFRESVNYVVNSNLMNGMSEDSFEPSTTMTRAMLVTVLWRLDSSPAPKGKAPFTDLKQSWYKKAVAWAYENNIVNGTSDNKFSPDGDITREQMATILYRYSEYKGEDITAKADLAVFTDSKSVSKYARKAMAWANAEDIITGTKDGDTTVLAPTASATRAQVATIFMRFCDR